MHVASTMPANDASKAICGASERTNERAFIGRRWDAFTKRDRETREELRSYEEQRASSGESERVERKHDENGTQKDIRKLLGQ